MLEVRGLTKYYGRRAALSGLELTAGRGVCGLLGRNGAGKTTALNIMAGYLAPTEGDVLIDGISVIDDPGTAKRRIGYLPEQPPLYQDLTVREYLVFAAELKKLGRAERRAEVERVMGKLKLSDQSERLIRNLSKGYRQRVGIAQAILGSPSVLILDEPMNGLDPRQILEMRALIREMGAQGTVILSSHILSEAEELCDSVVILEEGQTAAAGSPKELMSGYGGHSLEELFLALTGDEERASARETLAASEQEEGEAALKERSAPEQKEGEGDHVTPGGVKEEES